MAHIYINPDGIYERCRRMMKEADEMTERTYYLLQESYALASMMKGAMGSDDLAKACHEQLRSAETLREACIKNGTEILEYVEEMTHLIPPTCP